jgi:hypothetical protein
MDEPNSIDKLRSTHELMDYNRSSELVEHDRLQTKFAVVGLGNRYGKAYGGSTFLHGSSSPEQESYPIWHRTIRVRDLIDVSQLLQRYGGKSFIGIGPEERFMALVAQWDADTQFTSSLHELVMHDAYQRIIGMGAAALPYIFRDLASAPSWRWFWALRAIAGEDPAEGLESVEHGIAAWQAWGRVHGYVT